MNKQGNDTVVAADSKSPVLILMSEQFVIFKMMYEMNVSESRVFGNNIVMMSALHIPACKFLF